MVSPRFPLGSSARAIPLALAVASFLPFHLAGQTTPQPQPSAQTPAAQPSAPLSPEDQARVTHLQASLQSAIAARDAHTAAKILNQLGDLWLHAGNAQNATDAYNRAVNAARLAQDAQQGVAALNGLGNAALAQHQAQDAAQDYQRALDVATAQSVVAGKADALNGLALLSASQNQGQQALNYANQALAIRQSLGDRAGQAAILAEIATGYNNAGDQQRALDYANRALDLYRAAGDHTGEAAALIGIGDIYASLRDKKCMDAWTQALAVARQFNFSLVQAEALNRLGLAQNALQQNQKALDSFNQALVIYQRLNMTDGAGLMLNNIGLAWSGLGQMEKAIDSFNQALPILRAAGDEDGQGIALQNIGLMHQFLGDRQTAIQYYKEAFPHLVTARDSVNGLTLLDNLGSTLAATGDYQNALLFLNKVISMQKGMPNREHEALARIIIGMVYHKMGDNPKAIDSVNQGLELISHLNDPANESRARTGLAKIYLDMGDAPNALANLNQALPLAEAANDPLILSPILYGMMLAHKSQPALAIFYGKQSVNLLQQVRSNMQGLDKELQSAFVTSISDFYHDLAALLIAQGRLPEAQQVLDLLKQQEYSDYVRGAGTDSLSPLSLTPDELKAQQDYDKSTAQLVAAGVQWNELKELPTRTPAQEQQLKDLSDRIKLANKALDDYYTRLYTLFRTNSDAANDRLKNVKGNVSALQDQIAESPHTVALYTMVTANHISVIVITPNATVAHDYTIAAADLNKKVADFQQVLHSPSSDPKPLAQDLYNILIGPVQADLDNAKAETLVWSLDGVLRYIPIAALYDGKQYVVQKYNTVTITPASIDHLEDKPDVSKLSVAAMGIARKYEENLPPLPAVATELNDVVKDAQVQGANGVLPGTILLDGQFTEKAMEDQLNARPGVVHIASHFVFSPGDDSQSYLLLSGKDTPGAGFHLTVAEFHSNPNLSLRHTDLLTLSACETGMSGSASDGREVDGLGTTAQLKGAKAVISSLWPVNDASTGQLMSDFYKRWADGAGKVTKVEALRKAQLDLLLGQVKPQGGATGRGVVVENETPGAPAGYAHPYYWAPFVLMGNWR
jgi:CHAT domain-containing protein